MISVFVFLYVSITLLSTVGNEVYRTNILVIFHIRNGELKAGIYLLFLQLRTHCMARTFYEPKF